jgi:beta-lactamase superfamily II metal-dependent hydrolase
MMPETLGFDAKLELFDVNHGACALLTMPSQNGVKRILIDCGHSTTKDTVKWSPGRYLQGIGVSHLDVLFITNYDEDHASGYVDVLEHKIAIGCIFGNPTVPPETILQLKTADGMGRGIATLAASIAERKKVGHAENFPVVPGLGIGWCCNSYPEFSDENNLSLVLALDVLGIKFLFTGDMELAGFSRLLQTYEPFKAMVAETDMLVVSHHGRISNICTALFEQHGCKPTVVVISDDYRQYVSQQTTNYYVSKAKGLTDFRGKGPRSVLTTRKDGVITFTFNKDESCVIS